MILTTSFNFSKRAFIIFSICLLLAFCTRKSDTLSLRNTKWQTQRFEIDSSNYLTDIEKSAYLSFDTSVKLFSDYRDSIVYTYVDGKFPDTSNYTIKEDTLFYIHKETYRDTNIIIKLSSDSLILKSLAGVKTYSLKLKDK